METIKQVEEEFNAKKTTKKKGWMIGAIIAAVTIIALLIICFLVFTSPKYIFGKAIDAFFNVESENYETLKMDTKIKADVDLEDTT